ncbi:hypothetical protein F5X71_27820 [Nocardia brasiliensis]|uniref:Acyl-CoA dehydrogenase/oxidase N-terminal domain-containing protein n=1 Tax=Nocardia brasiliensis TaxID=37326 RepID=A0A6G9XXF0_NOCBR|nr:acyl-CoA dehydrogenase family protein [Nocardia brasiliensis]QIS05612.1 hypothetical protein F5X71_27820 [Nocardia brasiliensis]
MYRSKLSAAHLLAAELDTVLGDPEVPGSPFSFRDTVLADNRLELPPGARQLLVEWGFHHLLVPQRIGGRLRDFDELFLASRTVAQRNMAAAVMFGSSFLAALPIWLWGTTAQQQRLADGLLDGASACFALSEEEHGSDLRATETTLTSFDSGWSVTGRKWPVGNAGRARFCTAFARSGKAEFSLVLIDLAGLAARAVEVDAPIRHRRRKQTGDHAQRVCRVA